MNLRKDNHYIPQLYLKQWATNGKIPTYRLLVPNENYPTWKTHSLKSICFHQHLYTYIATQGETDELERWLDREFESPAADAIDRVVRAAADTKALEKPSALCRSSRCAHPCTYERVHKTTGRHLTRPTQRHRRKVSPSFRECSEREPAIATGKAIINR